MPLNKSSWHDYKIKEGEELAEAILKENKII
jgi:hypothetical protein